MVAGRATAPAGRDRGEPRRGSRPRRRSRTGRAPDRPWWPPPGPSQGRLTHDILVPAATTGTHSANATAIVWLVIAISSRTAVFDPHRASDKPQVAWETGARRCSRNIPIPP